MFVGVLDELGYQGPLILVLVVAWLVQDGPFFLAFLAGFWMNKWLNEWLKGIVREPRPMPIDLHAAQMRDPLRRIWAWLGWQDWMVISRAHVWGMPSGHAQTASFALAYYYLVREKRLHGWGIWWTGFGAMLLLGVVTLFQRWNSKAHSSAQLTTGVIVGGLMAGAVFFGVKWAVRTWRDFMKNEDEE